MFQSPHRITSRPLFDEAREMRQEHVEEAVLRRLPMRAARSRRQVHADDRQRPDIGLEEASLAIEFLGAESGRRRMRQLRVHGDAAVALAQGGVERRVRSARRPQRARHVRLVTLDFLHADDVPRLGAREPAGEALALRGAQAVDVQGDDAHRVVGCADRGDDRRRPAASVHDDFACASRPGCDIACRYTRFALRRRYLP